MKKNREVEGHMRQWLITKALGVTCENLEPNNNILINYIIRLMILRNIELKCVIDNR